MRLFILSIAFLASAQLFSQCLNSTYPHDPSCLPDWSYQAYPWADWDDINVYVNFVAGPYQVYLTTIAAGGSESVEIEQSTNAFQGGPPLVIENIVFVAGCRCPSYSSLISQCDAGSFCTRSGGECNKDISVWTPPAASAAKCNNIDFIFTDAFSSRPDAQFFISYVNTFETCLDTLYLMQDTIMTDDYQANNIVSNQAIETNGNIIFKVESSAVLYSNFHASIGGVFSVEIEMCPDVLPFEHSSRFMK